MQSDRPPRPYYRCSDLGASVRELSGDDSIQSVPLSEPHPLPDGIRLQDVIRIYERDVTCVGALEGDDAGAGRTGQTVVTLEQPDPGRHTADSGLDLRGRDIVAHDVDA